LLGLPVDLGGGVAARLDSIIARYFKRKNLIDDFCILVVPALLHSILSNNINYVSVFYIIV
jgi:hypothetical protein